MNYVSLCLWAVAFLSITENVCKLNTDLTYDLTVVGKVNFADGIGRHAIEIIDMLSDSLKINFLSTCGKAKCVRLKDVPLKVQRIMRGPYRRPGAVALHVDLLWYHDIDFTQAVPNGTKIKIAYSVFESTFIPSRWVSLLNTKFDAVAVPDPFVKEAYSNSGVKIPIFVLPLPIYIDKFLQKPLKTTANNPFAFGMSAQFFRRKNHELLLDAFIKEFGNNPGVGLHIHGRKGDTQIFQRLKNRVALSGCTNVHLLAKALSEKKYNKFMSSLDCYVFVSSGEGFSITSREALACGIPCILTNNSAHKTVCNTGFVKAVPALLQEPAYYTANFGGSFGYFFTPTIDDVRKAMRDVYTNYDHWLKKAQCGREWVKQYLAKCLKIRYLSLIKPKKVILGNNNSIGDGYLMTTSLDLYRKYKSL